MRTLAQLAGVEYPFRLDQTETGFSEVSHALATYTKPGAAPLNELVGAEKLKLSYRARFLEFFDIPATRVPAVQWLSLISKPEAELPARAAAYRAYYIQLLRWLYAQDPARYQAEMDRLSA